MTILTEDDFSLLTRFKIRAMGDKLREIIDDESMDHMGFEEKIKFMLDAETIARSDRKVERLIRQARFKYKDASIEGIQYPPDRKLSRERVERLATCQWIRDRETLIIISSTGSGKSYISQALGNAACRQGIPTRYTRLQDMLEQIDRARLDGQDEYYRKVDEFKTIQLLILDDFLTTPITAADSVLIFEIMETRNGTGTTLIASQCEPEQWHVRISSELIADSTLSRITGAARYLELEGPDMRTQTPKHRNGITPTSTRRRYQSHATPGTTFRRPHYQTRLFSRFFKSHILSLGPPYSPRMNPR